MPKLCPHHPSTESILKRTETRPTPLRRSGQQSWETVGGEYLVYTCPDCPDGNEITEPRRGPSDTPA